MELRRFNWTIWAGSLLTVFAFVSYFLIFVNYPVTRDFPWATLLIFLIAIALIVVGFKRGFSRNRRWPLLSKAVTSILTLLSVGIVALFVFTIFIAGRQLPASKGAPQVGQKAPDFTLNDSNGNAVSLSGLIASPLNGDKPKGVLLVFYRGYW